jgi:Rrf2 family nitric oxide-sensitive transcriptional repressor
LAAGGLRAGAGGPRVRAVRLSLYTDYSFRVLMHAALRRPQRVTVDEVAGVFGISRNHLVKVVHDLGRNGFLQTHRGIGGGFTLARPPEEIRLGAVARLGEEGEAVIECVDRKKGVCRILPACRLKGVLDEAAAAFFGVLDGYTLEELVRAPDRMRAVLGIAPADRAVGGEG